MDPRDWEYLDARVPGIWANKQVFANSCRTRLSCASTGRFRTTSRNALAALLSNYFLTGLFLSLERHVGWTRVCFGNRDNNLLLL